MPVLNDKDHEFMMSHVDASIKQIEKKWERNRNITFLNIETESEYYYYSIVLKLRNSREL